MNAHRHPASLPGRVLSGLVAHRDTSGRCGGSASRLPYGYGRDRIRGRPPIPEPEVDMLMSVGLGLVAWAARRRMRPRVPRLDGRSDATLAIAPQ